MKILFTILILFLSLSAFAQEGWKDVTPAGNYTSFYGLDVVDSENIWVVGNGGMILKTTNGGSTWNEINSPVTYDLYHVDFVNSDTGMIGGYGVTDCEIYTTTNGGISWNLTKLDSGDYSIYDIEYVEGGAGESSKAYVTAGRSLTWTTEDAGESWGKTSIQRGCGFADIQSICFLNKDEGWFVGTAAQSSEVTIIHTTDGGATYEIQDNPTDPDIKLNSVSFADNQHGIAAGIDPNILYTSDGGKNWETRSVSNYRWESVHMNPSGKAWAVGRNGIILYSNDWGYTWTAQESGVTSELWEVIFIGDNEGWIVGGYPPSQPAVILHTSTGGLVTDVNKNKIVNEFKLHQNYPNPFNPSTKINYSIPKKNIVVIKVYDILGKEIATLVNEEKSPGNYEVEFNGNHLSSGIYFYSLKAIPSGGQAGYFKQTKIMVLIK